MKYIFKSSIPIMTIILGLTLIFIAQFTLGNRDTFDSVTPIKPVVTKASLESKFDSIDWDEVPVYSPSDTSANSWFKVAQYSHLYIGGMDGISINIKTGEVDYPGNLSDASRIFWEGLSGYFPCNRDILPDGGNCWNGLAWRGRCFINNK